MTRRQSIRRCTLGAAALLVTVATLTTAARADDEAFKRSLAENLRGAAEKLVALAEATEADLFSWRPSPEVRSVSQVYVHVVGSNFQLPALLGAPSPEGIDVPTSGPYALGAQRAHWEAEIDTKEEVLDYLRRSFGYALDAVLRIETLDEEVAPFGFKASKRDYLLLLMAHAHEHLGQAIAYARGAGVVPPWSRGAPAAGGTRPEPASTAVFEDGSARGETLSIDRFGNLETSFVGADLTRFGLQTGDVLVLSANGQTVEVFLGESFFDVQIGEWVGFVAQTGRLLVGRSYASAAATLDVSDGSALQIRAGGSPR